MGNACSSGAVNAPKRGEWPRHPKQTHCLLCGTELWINRKGDPNKKFCNEKCACRYNMERKHGAEWKRQAAKEPCLKCHDALLMKSRMSAGLVSEKRAFVLDRRKRMGFDSTPIMSRASKHAHLSNGTLLSTEAKIKRATEKAWACEWRGVVDCHYAKWGHAYLRAAVNRRAVWRRRYRFDAAFTAKRALRNQTARIKRRTKWSKGSNELLGCTYAQARKWIESQFQRGMSWNNVGEWEIDHIVPISSFDLTDERQVRCVNHFTNLRPLWAQDNRRKRDKLEVAHQLALL